MLKNKIGIISLIMLLVISLLAPMVKAENEVEATTTDQVDPISQTQETYTIKEGDEYLFEQNVTIDTPVDGNLFIIANNVTIDSQIGGDAFICANTITVEEDAYILSNLFACANTINIKGAIYNIYSIGDTLTIDGFVYRDIRSVCNSLNINGMVGRNVFVDCSDIHFKENTENTENSSIASYGTIQGNLNYSSDEEITIPENAVSGEVIFSQLANYTFDITDYIYSLGTILVSVIVIWLIGLWFAPKLLQTSNKTMSWKKALQIIGLGIIVPIVITLLTVIILLIPIASQFVLLLLCLLMILFFISTSVTLIDINDGICNKCNITKNVYKLGFLIIITFIYWLLTFVPYLGTILSLITVVWGIGSVSYKLFIKENENDKPTTTDNTKKDEDKTLKEKKEERKSKAKKEKSSDKATDVKKDDKSDGTAKDQK